MIDIVKKKIRIDSNGWFLFTFSFWNILDILQGTCLEDAIGEWFGVFISVCNWIVLAMLVIQILWFQRYNGKKETLLLLIISVVVVVATVSSKNNIIMSLWLFVMAAKKVDIELCVKRAYGILCFTLPLVIILYVAGMIPEYTMYRGNLLRHSLGFEHPNTLGMRIFQLVTYHFFLRRVKLRFFDFLLLAVMCFFVYRVPNSQTSVIAMGILFVCFLVYSIIKNKNEKICRRFSIVLLFLSIASNMISVYFGILGISDNGHLQKIDNFMSHRLSLIHQTYLRYGITGFGQKVIAAGDSIALLGRYYNGDNAYMIMLIQFGVLVYAAFTVGYLLSIISFIKKHEYTLVIIFTVFALYGIMENNIFSLTYNIFLLEMSRVIYRRAVTLNSMY